MNLPEWVTDIGGNFLLHKAVLEGAHLTPSWKPHWHPSNNFVVMSQGTKVLSAESWGISAWTKTAKISVTLSDGSPKRYFLKVSMSMPVCY